MSFGRMLIVLSFVSQEQRVHIQNERSSLSIFFGSFLKEQCLNEAFLYNDTHKFAGRYQNHNIVQIYQILLQVITDRDDLSGWNMGQRTNAARCRTRSACFAEKGGISEPTCPSCLSCATLHASHSSSSFKTTGQYFDHYCHMRECAARRLGSMNRYSWCYGKPRNKKGK